MRASTRFVHWLVLILRLDNILAYLACKNNFIRKLVPLPHEYRPGTLRIVERNGIKLNLDVSDYMQWTLYVGVPDFSWRYVTNDFKPGNIVLDVGANIGNFTLQVANEMSKREVLPFQIHAFEPNPTIFNVLSQHIEQNGFTKYVKVYKAALGDTSGFVPFNFNPRNSGGGRTDKQGITTVQIITLDEWIQSSAIQAVSFIKIDVEGFEPEVLLGGEQTILKYRPSLYIEVTDVWIRKRGYSKEWLFKVLHDWGYKWWVDNDGTLETFNTFSARNQELNQFNIFAKQA